MPPLINESDSDSDSDDLMFTSINQAAINQAAAQAVRDSAASVIRSMKETQETHPLTLSRMTWQKADEEIAAVRDCPPSPPHTSSTHPPSAHAAVVAACEKFTACSLCASHALTAATSSTVKPPSES
ncbi:hypothetical protein EMPG_11273 [Blastomyces silverae]|uniref:Uncharacterized protein n=1 Tax=Blastomyces silverae TaxID=2060906 RepID=A0A0H1BQM4_9EURO|nr:hypothetical protein EMPG_11273 [Blastomyces silverae]